VFNFSYSLRHLFSMPKQHMPLINNSFHLLNTADILSDHSCCSSNSDICCCRRHAQLSVCFSVWTKALQCQIFFSFYFFYSSVTLLVCLRNAVDSEAGSFPPCRSYRLIRPAEGSLFSPFFSQLSLKYICQYLKRMLSTGFTGLCTFHKKIKLLFPLQITNV